MSIELLDELSKRLYIRAEQLRMQAEAAVGPHESTCKWAQALALLEVALIINATLSQQDANLTQNNQRGQGPSILPSKQDADGLSNQAR